MFRAVQQIDVNSLMKLETLVTSLSEIERDIPTDETLHPQNGNF